MNQLKQPPLPKADSMLAPRSPGPSATNFRKSDSATSSPEMLQQLQVQVRCLRLCAPFLLPICRDADSEEAAI
jgi:hypothetical protein